MVSVWMSEITAFWVAFLPVNFFYFILVCLQSPTDVCWMAARMRWEREKNSHIFVCFDFMCGVCYLNRFAFFFAWWFWFLKPLLVAFKVYFIFFITPSTRSLRIGERQRGRSVCFSVKENTFFYLCCCSSFDVDHMYTYMYVFYVSFSISRSLVLLPIHVLFLLNCLLCYFLFGFYLDKIN